MSRLQQTQYYLFSLALVVFCLSLFFTERFLSHTMISPLQYAAVLPERTITIGSSTMIVEIARTSVEREAGLSNRPTLPLGHGMLFIFDHPDTYQFWMPHMHFALDMVWIGSDRRIVDITQNATPESFPTLFEPKVPAQYVLEVPAGYADQNNWKDGLTMEVGQ